MKQIRAWQTIKSGGRITMTASVKQDVAHEERTFKIKLKCENHDSTAVLQKESNSISLLSIAEKSNITNINKVSSLKIC